MRRSGRSPRCHPSIIDRDRTRHRTCGEALQAVAIAGEEEVAEESKI
jgi:hypothetical protein